MANVVYEELCAARRRLIGELQQLKREGALANGVLLHEFDDTVLPVSHHATPDNVKQKLACSAALSSPPRSAAGTASSTAPREAGSEMSTPSTQ